MIASSHRRIVLALNTQASAHDMQAKFLRDKINDAKSEQTGEAIHAAMAYHVIAAQDIRQHIAKLPEPNPDPPDIAAFLADPANRPLAAAVATFYASNLVWC